MNEQAINEHLHKATYEALASYVVGIAILDNTAIGTGTLISYRGKRYVLTAEHVITGTTIETIRFWFRPPQAITVKAAKDTTDAEIGEAKVGLLVPIVGFSTSTVADIAILEIDPKFEMPVGAEFYDVSKSAPFSKWQPEELEGLTLFIFGFPTDNSRAFDRVGNSVRRFLGATIFLSKFDLATTAPPSWKGLASSIDPSKDFLFSYTIPDVESIQPRGFSGGGVWIASDTAGRPLWTSEPRLIGVIHTYFKSRGLIAASQMPVVLSVLRDHIKHAQNETQNKPEVHPQ
jgi:hypothetical protein